MEGGQEFPDCVYIFSYLDMLTLPLQATYFHAFLDVIEW